MTHTATDSTTDHILDEEWLAAPRRRSRLRQVLLALLAATVFFLAGAQVQKHLGAGEEAAAGPAGGFAGAPQGGGLPAGAPEGLGEGGFPQGAPQGQDQGAGAGEDEEADDGQAVIGAVVEIDGDTWVVEDLGGTRHRVVVDAETGLVRESDLDAADVAAGDRVDITGTGTEDRIRAEQVTVR